LTAKSKTIRWILHNFWLNLSFFVLYLASVRRISVPLSSTIGSIVECKSVVDRMWDKLIGAEGVQPRWVGLEVVTVDWW
jgi:hypothetical protein